MSATLVFAGVLLFLGGLVGLGYWIRGIVEETGPLDSFYRHGDRWRAELDLIERMRPDGFETNEAR